MILLVLILALTLGGVALSAGVAMAIGRAGAAADADLDRLLDEHRRPALAGHFVHLAPPASSRAHEAVNRLGSF